MKIFNWIFSVFCILCLPIYGFHAGPVLMCLLGILSLPIDPMKELWENLPKPKLRPLIIGILFVVFCCMIPTRTTQPDIAGEISTETETRLAEIETETQETETQEVLVTETESEVPTEVESVAATQTQPSTEITLSMDSIPAYSGEPYVAVNDNVPEFRDTDLSTSSYEYYSDLDELGRCGVAVSNIGKDLMPTKKRGSIGKVKPSGWHTVKYDFVDGKYLYNRCHLIGYQLTAENANEKNLITGTRYMNVDGMLPFENMVADYIKETGNHVLYRVTPIYTGDNLVADGVEMEARSVEDDGDGICYHVLVYNEQPGVAIDHATGESHLAEDAEVYASQAGSGDERAEEIQTEAPAEQTQVQEQAAAASEYILNTNTMKFHRPSCSSVNQMSDSNKWVYDGTREEVLNMGYDPCKRCNP